MDCIKHLLLPHVKHIELAENQMSALAYKMYEILDKYLNDIITDNWMGPNSKLAVIGGIMINCEGPKTDMFLPLRFDVRSKQGKLDSCINCL